MHPFPPLAFCPNRPKTGSKRGQSFLSFARGLRLFSRPSAPSSLSSPRSPFRMFRVSFRLRSWYNNSGMRCRPQTLQSIYSWCHKTCPVSSRQVPRNVFTKLSRFYFIAMIRFFLRNASHWSVYELKSDHRRRMFKGRWRRQTKVPRTFREEDLQCLLDFVIDNSHFEINGYLFRQERGVAMGSPAAPPLCNLVATVEDNFWHQTMDTLRFQLPDFGVIWHERYVDNRFILLRDAAPSSAVLRNFLSLEFYRPPVMLETQNDTKVLGYMCDSASRTITPHLPDHPSQIKGIRSANDQMFTYTSWSSRSWLIVRGAQPAIQQQQVGLDALKRLYEAKGFNPDLLRFAEEWNQMSVLIRFALLVSLLTCVCSCVVVCMCAWFGAGSDFVVVCLSVLILLLAWRRCIPFSLRLLTRLYGPLMQSTR